MSDAHLLDALELQARTCRVLGSPMYEELLTRIIRDIRTDGVFAEVLSGHQDDPGPSALALRLLGGLHRLVLEGRAPMLRRWYPSVGGSWDAVSAWPDVVDAARSQLTRLRSALEHPPQTNEVGRSAALIGGLLFLLHRFPFPIRLFEIGASAGLNLRADHYRYRFTGGQWGPVQSTVVIDDAWRGRPPPDGDLQIIERHGFDVAPVDVTRDGGRLTLLSYVWPDMPGRLQRLDGAIDIARRVPARLDRMSAAQAVKRVVAVPGTLTVLWHSVTWQYLTAAERQRVTDEIEVLAGRADVASPLVWLSFEPRRRTPESAHEFLLRACCWPDGTDEILGVGAAHGPPVTWD